MTNYAQHEIKIKLDNDLIEFYNIERNKLAERKAKKSPNKDCAKYNEKVAELIRYVGWVQFQREYNS